MRTMNKVGTVLGLMSALTLGGCAGMNDPSNPFNTTPAYGSTPDYQSSKLGNAYSGYGVVQSIELVPQDNSGIAGTGIGMGTVAGALIGGVAGNQVGSGRGNIAATVIGAAGGAYLGHELENRYQQNEDAYQITVRMQDGSYQTLTQSADPGLRVGERVLVGNGIVQRY